VSALKKLLLALRALAKGRLRWLLLFPIPLVWCFLGHSRGRGEGEPNGALTFLENKLLDWRFHYRGPIASPVKVIYVDVDSISIDEIGGWPWSRTFFARVIRTLIEKGGARAVGMDFVFSKLGIAQSVDHQKWIDGNRDLGIYLLRTPSVVVAASYAASDFRDSLGKRLVRDLPLVASGLGPIDKIEPPETPQFDIGRTVPFSPPGVAIIDTLHSATRWVPLYTPSNVRTYYHMAVELARIYYGLDRDGVRIGPDSLDFVRPDGSVVRRVPLTDSQLVEINWFSRWRDAAHNPRASFNQIWSFVLNLDSDNPEAKKAAEEFFSQEFKDSVVLIGPVDPLLQDLASTPMDDEFVPKVGVHGNLLKTIISGEFIRRPPEIISWILVFALTGLVTTLGLAGGGRAMLAKLAAVFSMVFYVGLCFEAFRRANLVLPIAAPVGAAFSTSFVALVWQIVIEQKQRGRIKGLFSTYVSPALVTRMIDSGEEPKLGGVEEQITAYFSDIQAFSTFSEKLSPPRLVELMNEYLTACTDIVQAEGGTLDKYIGDAVVAIYGAPLALPDNALRSCVAALRVHKRIDELREKWKHEGDKWPEIVHKLQTRIGLNSGRAVVGNMGSHTRFNYTMMGDNVNLAARMESGAKSWGAYSMCAESTKIECEKFGPDAVVFRALGRIVVMGRAQPVPIFEIVALKEDATDAARECIGIFGQAMERHYARDWDGAIALFQRSAQLEPNMPGKTPGVKTNPSLVYIDITEGYKSDPPPPEWNGVYVMKEK